MWNLSVQKGNLWKLSFITTGLCVEICDWLTDCCDTNQSCQTLVNYSQAHHVEGGDVGAQVPEQESAALSGWCLHPRRHTTRTSTAPFCCRWSAVGPQDKYQHRPTWVPLLWTSYVERLPVSLRTNNRSSDAFGRALKRHLFSIWCRLPLFALQCLLMWRIIT